MSIWPDITAVSVAGMPPVEVGIALMPSSLPSPSTMVWVVAPPVEYEMVVFSVVSLSALDRRIRAHVEKDVAGAGEVGADDADRRALGEGAQHPLGADIDAEIGAAGDHRLHRLARAGGAENLERDARAS